MGRRVQGLDGIEQRYLVPAAIAAVRGTDFRVGYEKDNATMRSEVLEGPMRKLRSVAQRPEDPALGYVE